MNVRDTIHQPKKSYVYGNQKEAELIASAVARFGCINTKQIPFFLPVRENKQEYNIPRILRYLSNTRQIASWDDTSTHVSSYVEHDYKHSVVDCIWVMIDLIFARSPYYDISEELEQSFKGNPPCNVCFIWEGRKIVKLLPLNNASDITNLMYEQERYAVESEKNKENFSYYAVTRDVSMIAKLKDYDVNLPLRIALIRDEEVDGRPKIQYVSLDQL